MKKLYIATPINSRPESSMEEKLEGARKRIKELGQLALEDERLKEYDTVISTFDVNPPDERSEARAMGRCVEAVLSSDAILLDESWNGSKGCTLEYRAARIYGIKVYLVLKYGPIVTVKQGK